MTEEQLSRDLQALQIDEDPNPAFAEALFAQLEDEVVARRGPSATWLLLAAAALIAALAVGAALGSGLVQLPLLIAEASPTATPTVSASAVASASPFVPPPSPTSTTQATPVSPDNLAPDGLARVTVAGLTLRAEPGLDGEKLGELGQDTAAFIVRGPVMADGYAWYEVAGLGLPPAAACAAEETLPLTCPTWFGWAASADLDGTPWLEGTSLGCPESPMNLETFAYQRGWNERLACNTGGTVTVRAWWSGPLDDGECTATGGGPSRWLYCVGLYGVPLWRDESEGSSALSSFGLLVSIDPESGVTMPQADQWVEIVGHLDDAAAEGCPEVGGSEPGTTQADEVVLMCRAQLVVDSVTEVSGPF